MIPEYSPQGLDSEAWEACMGTFFTCTDLDRSKAPETVSFLELSSVRVLTAELIGLFSSAHHSSDP